MHLQAARELGDELIVALTIDEYVNKPGQPINRWEDRRDVLLALSCVDQVIPSRNLVEVILQLRPHVLVKGIDYLDSPLLSDACDACAKVGAKVHITDTPKLSSREIIKKMANVAR